MIDDLIFIDTNLWIYEFIKSNNSIDKQKKEIISDLIFNNLNIYTSNQVLNELSNVLNKKYKIEINVIEKYVEKITDISYISIITLKHTTEALKLTKKYKYSFYDSLIIYTALNCNCTILYTEISPP